VRKIPWRAGYSHPGQSSAGSVGTLDKPHRAGRVLDDGTTQLHQYGYNPLGNVTSATDPVGRVTPDWSKVRVHPDAQVPCDYSCYSIPFCLIGETLWRKATATLLRWAVSNRLETAPIEPGKPAQAGTSSVQTLKFSSVCRP